MTTIGTFVNKSAFRNHYIEFGEDLGHKMPLAVAQAVFGNCFFGSYEKGEDTAAFIKEHGLKRLGTLDAHNFTPDLEGITPLATDLEAVPPALVDFIIGFAPGTPLRNFTVNLRVFPTGMPRVRRGIGYTGIGDLTDKARARYLATEHFNKAFIEVRGPEDVGDLAARTDTLLTLVDDGKRRYYIG